MAKVAEKIKEEFLAMIPPTIFFFVARHIVALVRTLMYCTTHELIRTIGRQKVMRIFFGPLPAPSV